MTFLGIDHVQLAAPPGCEAEARRFFGQTLGLEELAKPPALQARGGVWFRLGAQQLHVGVDPGFTAASKAHPALRVGRGEIEDYAAALEEAGAPVQWDTSLPHERRFFTRDPWGNRLELLATAG